MNEECLLAYLAGIVDGEGSITITYPRKLYDRHINPSPNLQIKVVMTDEQIPTLFHTVFGGGISHYKRPENPKWKSVWHWSASSSKAGNVLKQILPYLILKKPQAELGIKFRENYQPTLPGRGKRTPPDIVAYRLQFCEEMAKLNRKGE